MLKKKINFNKVRRVVIDGRVDKLRKEALNLETGIINRTLKGKNMKLKSFKKYTSEYSELKRKAGSASTVNLTGAYRKKGGGYKQGGTMLQAISNKKVRNGLRFYFNASAETKKAFWNQRKRKFFGVDKQQIKYLKKKLGKL